MALFLQLVPPVVQDPSALTAVYEALTPGWIGLVTPYAMELFGALALLDLAFFGWSLWKTYRGDVSAAILSTANRLLLIGLFLDLLLNGPTWMTDIIDMFQTVGKAANNNLAITPSALLTRGVDIAGAMMSQALKTGLFSDLLTGIALLGAAVVVVIGFLVITVEFVITKIQIFLVLGMGMFFFGFGGSTWTRTYVERYFGYAVSSGVRLMTLYFLIGAGYTLSQSWIALAAAAPLSPDGALATWIIACGAIIYAALCWRGPSIAAGMMSGGPNLSHNEVWGALGAAVQAGVAAAAVASGVGSAAGGAMAGGAAAKGGAAMAAGGTAPSGAGPGAAASVSRGMNGAGSVMAGAGQSHGASGGGSGKNGYGEGSQFGGLDS